MNRRFAIAMVGEDVHPYGLAFPTAVTTDDRRRVWIADRGTASVHIFDLADHHDGANHGYREIRRAGDIVLQQPAGLATDRQGRVYLTDSSIGNVIVFDKNGAYDRMLRSRRADRMLEKPTAIAISDNARTIYIADPPRHAVVAFNQEGESVGLLGMPGELSEPASISVADNDVYVLDTELRRVQVFNASGRLRRSLQWPDIGVPTAFAYAPALQRFFVANPRWMVVQTYAETDPSRSLAAFGQLGDGVDQMQRIEALHIDPQGNIYVIDSHHGKVLVYSATARP